MKRKYTRSGRPPMTEGDIKQMTGVALSPMLRNAARKRAMEIGLEGNLSAYVRNLIKQELVLRDYYDRMQKVYDKNLPPVK